MQQVDLLLHPREKISHIQTLQAASAHLLNQRRRRWGQGSFVDLPLASLDLATRSLGFFPHGGKLLNERRTVKRQEREACQSLGLHRRSKLVLRLSSLCTYLEPGFNVSAWPMEHSRLTPNHSARFIGDR